jgi:hypothetical protein
MKSLAIAALACTLSLSLAATPASAQSTPTPASAVPLTPSGVPMVGPTLGPPRVTWLFTQGDANGGRGDTLGPSSTIFEPIRLALLTVPKGFSEPGCKDSAAGAASASSPGFAMQHAAGLPLQLVPKLTLFGFSREGCQLDAGIGGALVYATPVAKDITFVASTGIFHLPHGGPNGTSMTTAEHARIDLVLTRPKGRSYSVGIGQGSNTLSGTITRITFGGTL